MSQGTLEQIKLTIGESDELRLDAYLKLDSISGFFKHIKKTLSGPLEIISDADIIPQPPLKPEQEKALKIISDIGIGPIKKFKVYTPEGVKSSMPEYTKVLKASLENVSGVQERILSPMNIIAATIASNPDNLSRAITDHSIKLADYDGIIKELKKHVDFKKPDDTTYMNFYQAYGSEKGFKESMDSSNYLGEMTLSTLGKGLADEVDKTSKVLDSAADIIARRDKEDGTKYGEEISEIIYSAAKEIELLSVLLFKVKLLTVSFEKTVTKINKEL